jgi:hypothetical protein
VRYFYCRLNPPRVDFVQTMSARETQVMQEHGVYWRGLMEQGMVAAFGVVADPQGPFGVGILTLDDVGDPEALMAGDPVIKAGIGARYVILPMPQAVTRP